VEELEDAMDAVLAELKKSSEAEPAAQETAPGETVPEETGNEETVPEETT